ncbi:MAG: hypothetical protein MJA83_04185, partial [Gammaproteobacteria bacterium]|nr:hypothetical protein [Gammaproteobacteria bacterium]
MAVINDELSRRAIKWSPSIVGFDGDPNSGSAPLVLQNAIRGDSYTNNDGDYFVKTSESSGTWRQGASAPAFSQGDIVTTVDPNAPNAAARPPANTFFIDQASTDAYLASQPGSPTAFADLDSFYDFLPINVVNNIDVNIIGTQRPSAVADSGVAGWDLTAKTFSGGGTLEFLGDPDTSNWTQQHPGGTVRSHTVGSLAPRITTDPATLPNDGSLKGQFLVTSNGYIGQIWAHDDQNIDLTLNISPVPVNDVTTFTIRRPSSQFINSQDSLAPFADIGIDYNPRSDASTMFPMRDIRIDGASNTSFTMRFADGFLFCTRVQIDAKFTEVGPPDGLQLVIRPSTPEAGRLFFGSSSIIADETATGEDSDSAGDSNAPVSFFNSYVSGHEAGWFHQFDRFLFAASVFDGVGASKLNGNASLEISGPNSNLAVDELAFFNPGVRSRIINTRTNDIPADEVHALLFSDGAKYFLNPLNNGRMVFDNNNTAAIVRIQANCIV